MAGISNEDTLTELHLVSAHNGLLYRSFKGFSKLKPIIIFSLFLSLSPPSSLLKPPPLINCQMRLMNNLTFLSPSIWLKKYLQEKQLRLRNGVVSERVFCTTLPLLNNETLAIKQNHTLPCFFLQLVIECSTDLTSLTFKLHFNTFLNTTY